MPALQSITAIFDGHITKIVYNAIHGNWYWTASGTTNEVIGTTGTFNVTLADGYVIDTASSTSGTISNITDTSFAIADFGTSTTVTITSKQSATPTLQFKHFYDAGTIGTGAFKFRHYSQQEPTPQLPKVSIRYDDDYVSGYIAYSLDNGATWSDYITTQTTLLTDVTQIKFKCKGLDGGLVIVKGVYNVDNVTGTEISPGYPTDREAYETENITITADTGFYYYCYYD